MAVLLAALAFPGKASPGILLPMLIVADMIAVLYYRRDCQWQILVSLFPATLIGVLLGYFVVDMASTEFFQKLIGLIILLMLLLNLAVEYWGQRQYGGRLVTSIVGVFAGASSMVANAAGPVFGIFLLQMGLTKEKFVGTRSWFFLLLNLVKLPFSISLGLITPQTLTLNLYSVPIILAGAWLGIKVLKMINLSLFRWLIRGAVLISIIRLLVF